MKEVDGSRNYRGRSAEERVSERRKRFIEAGIALYGEHGFRTTSVKAVCLAAELTERYFYESFANGEALLCETCTVIMDDLRQRAARAMMCAGDSVSERVRAAAHAYFSALLERPAAGRIILFEMEGVSPPVDAHYASELEKSTQLFVDWFFSSLKHDAHPKLNALVLAQGMLGALYQIAKEWMRSNFRLPVDAMTQHMQAMTVGICAAYSGALTS